LVVECQPPVECVEPGMALNDEGLPVLSLDPVCADSELPKVWEPLEVSGPVCVDYAVYHTDVTGDWEIFRLGELPDNPGANANLSQGVGPLVVDVSPSRSPGGDWIVFTSNRDDNWELYVSKVDGSEQRRVTFNNFAVDTGAMWSPDGGSIVFQSNRDGNWNLYLLNLGTGAETQLTDELSNELNPAFSPDSSRVVFQSDQSGRWQIYELVLGTGVETLLSDGAGDDFDPLYGPLGDVIGFHSMRGGEIASVYVMEANGANPEQVSAVGIDARNLSWSNDQALLAYNSDADGDQDIYVYELATGLTRKLTDNTTRDVAPTWLCSSPTLLWTSNAQPDQVTPAEVDDIYSASALPMTADPLNVADEAARLTDNEHDNRYPQNFPPIEFGSRDSQQPSQLRSR
jgi:Tol biopolymer transport system component